MLPVRQQLTRRKLEDIPGAVRREIASVDWKLAPGVAGCDRRG